MEDRSIPEDLISNAIEKYGDMVRRISFLYFRNSADVGDIFQEVFLKFFQNYYSFKVTSIEGLERLEIPYESREQSELLETVLELPPEYRKLIYLYYYEGWSVPEIADKLET